MDISYQYTKRRCDFGRQPLFCEQGPELCDSITTNVPEHKQYILRNPVHQPTQNTPCFSKHKVNTIRAEYTTTGANHAEGGWPKDVNVVDPEATQRYRRKIEKDDNYIHCVMSLASGMEHYVMQNNAIDMYRTYYAEMSSLPPVEKSSCRTVNVYRDMAADGGRPISSICWQSEGGHCFAVTYVDVDFNRNPRAPIDSYIWDIENANYPVTVLKPPYALLDLQFNPRDQNILIGGLMNGQVGIWDKRQNGVASGLCAPHVAHRELVRNVLYINSKSGQEFFSGGPDGACKWWDIRNMNEPTDEMIMDVVKSSFDVQTMANACGISALEYEPTIPTRFMAGTENGFVIGGNRKGKTPMEKLPAKFETHLGPVWSLERNPGFLKNFLTVGDWTVRVWSEDCRESAVLWSPPHRHKITAATWSPTRISLMIVMQWNGMLAIWDLLRRQQEPVLTMQVCEEPLLRVRVHEGGTMVACGSRSGNIYMVELSQNMSQSDKNDKSLLTALTKQFSCSHDGEINVSQPKAERLGRLCLFIACIAVWFARCTNEALDCLNGHKKQFHEEEYYGYSLNLFTNLMTMLVLTEIFDRESKRERILEARMREFRLKLRQAEEGSPAAAASEVDLTLGDRDLADATADYMQLVKKELASM